MSNAGIAHCDKRRGFFLKVLFFTPIHLVANGDVIAVQFKLDDLCFHAGGL